MPMNLVGILQLSYLLGLRKVGLFFFFFQAEDGIRDIGVTGVQTCALPISCCVVTGREISASPGARFPCRSRRNRLSKISEPMRSDSASVPIRGSRFAGLDRKSVV